MPLDDIEFDMSTAFGKMLKCSYNAIFQLPEGTIPDGFGIPFTFMMNSCNTTTSI